MKNKFLPAFVLALTIGLGGGCSFYNGGPSTGTPNGAVSYTAGTLHCNEAVPFNTAFDASLAGLRDLDYAVVDKNGDGLSAKIIARAPGDDKITVTIGKVSGVDTDISVRINTFGDEAKSQTVINAIKKNLP